jgi:CO/xanthine dehydrogenase FAD-binding subunit
MAALRARVKVYEQAGESPYWLEMTKEARLKTLAGQIITSFSVIRPGEPIGTAYAQVGRTPADRPIVCAAASALRQAGAWETVTVIGGLFHDLHAIELRVDAGDPDSGLSQLAAAVTEQAPSATYQSDYLGSAEYRRAIAPTLARRALETAIRNAG